MFSVNFNKQPFAQVAKVEDAVALGLAIHRSSNLPHKIVIVSPDGKEVISFTLESKKDA